nr:uncharacterized protein LOC108172528 [Malus domestica]
MPQEEAQDWFHTLPPCSIWNFNKFSLVFTKEYLSDRSIKKKSDHLFNMKKDPNESFRTYVKRFKAEKAKTFRCDDSIACSTFWKGLPADHPFFEELIMGENLTLIDCYALILRDLKDKLWFKVSLPKMGDTSKIEQTKYCALYRGPMHITNDNTTWMKYLEKLVKEDKCDQYVDRPAARPRREVDAYIEPLTKMIRINDIFAKFEHLGATNSSNKRKIRQARSVFQVQAIDVVPRPIVGFTEQDDEGVDFPHEDA